MRDEPLTPLSMNKVERPSEEVMNGNTYEDLVKRNEYIQAWMKSVGLIK
jgi:hypothetical protein